MGLSAEERGILDAEAGMDQAEIRLDEVYEERARVLAALTYAWQALGYSVWIGYDDKAPEWPVLYAMLPTGQVSWHITGPHRTRFFNHLNTSSAWIWDEHTTAEKYARLEAWRP